MSGLKKEVALFDQIKGSLIVSCQALPGEPLHSPYIMGRMAYAAMLGGAKGIRANGLEDIREIKKNVNLPIIGIIKQDYENSEVFITPTIKEIELLVNEGVDVIALDATDRVRPDVTTIKEFFPKIREKYPNQLFMADCSTYEEGMLAAQIGFDWIGTTLCGYTGYTKNEEIPNYQMIKSLVQDCPNPVIAEGGISSPDQLKKIMELGVHAAVVGSAITRPMEITKRFIQAVSESRETHN